MRLPDRVAARAAAFSLVGVANSVVGVSLIVISGLLGAGPVLANVLGYGVGLLVSFTLNSRVTFGTRPVDRYTVLRFFASFGLGFSINIAAVILATRIFHLHKLLGSLVGTPLYFATFYLLCECWVFRRQSKLNERY